MRSKVNILNRKVKYEYFILSSFNAGIMLTGNEIKSIRNNDANISDCYCLFKDKELFARNIYISEYKNSGYSDHDCTRDRKLLLNKTMKHHQNDIQPFERLSLWMNWFDKSFKKTPYFKDSIYDYELFDGSKDKDKVTMFIDLNSTLISIISPVSNNDNGPPT